MKTLILTHSKFFKCIAFLVIVDYCGCCLASPTRILDDRERLINIANKVDAIDNKLNLLSRGQDQHSLLTRIDQKLEKIDQKLDFLALQNGSIAIGTSSKTGGGQLVQNNEVRQGAKEQEEFPYFHCVTLISVQRTPTSNGIRFTFKFTKNTEEVLYRYHDGTGAVKSPESVVEDGDGVWSVSFTCNSTGEDQPPPWFAFSDKVEEEGWSFLEYRHILHLRLNNTESSESFQQVGGLPELHVDPPRAAIYEPGQDFNVTAFIPANDLTQERPYIFESIRGINMSNGEIYMDMDRDKILRDMNENSDTDEATKNITLLTSSSTVNGYLSLGFGIQFEGPIIVRAQVNRIIELRPSNQTTLPPNYLGIFNTPYAGKSGHGDELRECRPGVECSVFCYGAGEAISDMNVVKLLADGSQEPVFSAVKSDIYTGLDFRIITWKFQAEEDSGDDDGISTFQCSASDDTHDKEVTKLVEVLVLLDDGIDDESSNVTVRVDDMDPDIKYLTFSCAMYGRPLPKVTFSGGTSYIFNMNSYEPDKVIKTGQNKAVAKKTLTLDMGYLIHYNYRIYEDDVLPSCGFFSKSQSEYVEHTFEIPNLGLEN
ncbi:hypothetical protein RRG08_029622 [Elysia crispata]|uniref:Uncharacterized protein n=1 Tax=Elysia crispata TaxID=231223 RepID=A0AAE1CJM0_9GAST|nr:hypothetical protein RRG08_029622 [Elysia crispata]